VGRDGLSRRTTVRKRGFALNLKVIGSCFHRLAGNDRVDPYVAVYELPTPSELGDITHLRWRGLLPPEFVQTIIDTAESVILSLAIFLSDR
jgi:hypothetical protein